MLSRSVKFPYTAQRRTFAYVLRGLQDKTNCTPIASLSFARYYSNNLYHTNSRQEDNVSAVGTPFYFQQRCVYAAAHQNSNKYSTHNTGHNYKSKSLTGKGKLSSRKTVAKSQASKHRKHGKSYKKRSNDNNAHHKNNNQKRKHFSTSQLSSSKSSLQKLHSKSHHKSAQGNANKHNKMKKTVSNLTSSSNKKKQNSANQHYRSKSAHSNRAKNSHSHQKNKSNSRKMSNSLITSTRKHNHIGRPKQSAARRFVKKVAKSFKHAIGKD